MCDNNGSFRKTSTRARYGVDRAILERETDGLHVGRNRNLRVKWRPKSIGTLLVDIGPRMVNCALKIFLSESRRRLTFRYQESVHNDDE